MKFEPGQKIGVYRIVRLLGEGGMGAVYEVVHDRLGVRYALKVFTAQCAHADVLKKKFLAEGITSPERIGCKEYEHENESKA